MNREKLVEATLLGLQGKLQESKLKEDKNSKGFVTTENNKRYSVDKALIMLNNIYDIIYDNEDELENILPFGLAPYTEKGDKLIKNNDKNIEKLIKARTDLFTSDREVTALGMFIEGITSQQLTMMLVSGKPIKENKEVKTESEKDKVFNGVEFEKNIPHNMRFKQYDVVNTFDLYWITQAPFSKSELDEFVKAFKETQFGKAYVTVRDFSTYDFPTDLSKNVFAVVSKDGGIDISGYEKHLKKAGWEDLLTESKLTENEEDKSEEETTEEQKLFYCAFQLSKLVIFNVNYKQLKGNQEPDFATSCDVLMKNKRDLTRCGQCQDDVLPPYKEAYEFYKKWDKYHLHKLDNEQYNEMIKDLDVLKNKYNYIEKDSDFRFWEIVDFSKQPVKGKHLKSESVKLQEAYWCGVKNVIYRPHGEWADGEVEYKGKLYNENDLQEYLGDIFDEYCEENNITVHDNTYHSLFSKWCSNNPDEVYSALEVLLPNEIIED